MRIIGVFSQRLLVDIDDFLSRSTVTAGSLSFYTAHLERGGLKRRHAPAQVAPRLIQQLEKED